MTPARFGEPNAPIEMPIEKSTSANTGYEKSIGSSRSSTNDAAAPSMPPVAKGRAPRRSDRMPATGPASTIPVVSGSM